MWKSLKISLLSLLFLVACTGTVPDTAQSAGHELWSPIEPYETGYLKVSEVHELYYELCGAEEGTPVIFLHGGPGGSCSPELRQFCDPGKFKMLLFDQRGAGRSRPFGEIRENTTQHLVEDIEQLRKHLKLEKVILFGGSWGTTLGLAYAETYPENVAGMVLRGVFLATDEEIDHFYHGAVADYFPGAYRTLIESLPEPGRRPLPDYLFELISEGTEEEAKKYSDAWARYEIKVSGLHVPDHLVERVLKEHDFYAFGLFENLYMKNRCFLEQGELLNNVDRIAHIPTVIVAGRYDVICPPRNAYMLHQRLNESKLVIAESAGHWRGEPAIQSALLEAMKSFEK